MMPDTRLLATQRVLLRNGKYLRVARLGQGPPIVFLHGYPENLQIWSRLAPLLADRFEVIACDWPGMGYSDEWAGGATPRLQAERLLMILDELGIQQPILVGLDMGGQPALVCAALHQDRIARVVVMNSLVLGNEPTSWEICLLRKFGFNRFALRTLPRLIFFRAERTFLPPRQRLDQPLRDDFQTAFFTPAVRRFISKMCAGYQGSLDRLPDLYRTIKCPTLILWAEHDKHFPVVQAERLHEITAGSVLEIIPGGTHWMPLIRADELARSIADFAG